MKTGIIGLGLIGGSMAIDLKRRGFAEEILGVEAEPVNASAAVKIGLVDRVVSLEECVRECDVIVLAVPVGTASRMLPSVLDSIGGPESEKVVIDVCSTKNHLVKAVKDHPSRRRYVATHPMAGTEYSGPWAAMPGLFDGHACIICDPEDSAPQAVSLIEDLYNVLNMRTIEMSAENHDVHTAYVSHISHVTSFSLSRTVSARAKDVTCEIWETYALTVLDKEKDEKHIFDLASGGFSSTVRLAKSSPDMWTPILSQNRDNVLHVMDTYIDKMNAFRQAIADGDEERVRGLIEEANRIRRILR